MLCREHRRVLWSLWSHQKMPCREQTRVLCVANRQCDNVAAPNRNLADLVENRSVFDENWGVLDENVGPAGLPSFPAK